MKRIDRSAVATARHQGGTTLILALVLLLLATLLSLFAMNVGIFAQRTSAADLRGRVIHQTLEAALSQGIEYIKNNQTSLVASMQANPCVATDITFPCGTVPRCSTKTTAADSSGNTSDGDTSCPGGLSRRGTMFYYKYGNTGFYDANGNGGAWTDGIDRYALPLDATTTRISTSDGFNVNYGVGAVLCMVKKPTLVTDPTECTTDVTKLQGTYVFTVTAVGNLTNEASNTTLSTVFAISPNAPGAGSAPTVVASGSVALNGNGTFVTAPDGAGHGMPVTVWTPQCVNTQGAGTVNTCHLESWLRASSGTFTYATNSDGSTSAIPVCAGNGNNACSCTDSLSAGSGNLVEGIDILSNDSKGSCTGGNLPVAGTTGTGGCNGSSNCKANYNVDETEFPCDLFKYIFGTPAWDDMAVQSPGTANAACTEGGLSGGGDCFCEKKKSGSFTGADNNPHTVGADEVFLYANASFILPTTAHTSWVSSTQLATSCADMITKATSVGGILWDQTGGCLKSSTQIGYPDFPVILVEDGSADLQGATMFGLLFVRDTTAPGSSTTYGGAANFVGHSTGTIYGSVVVQGAASKINGTSAVVYIPQLMTTLANEKALQVSHPIPGSWTDRYAY